MSKWHKSVVELIDTGRITHGSYAGRFYPIQGTYPKGHPLRLIHIIIQDEPSHEDSINISSFDAFRFKKGLIVEKILFPHCFNKKTLAQ